MFGTVTPHISSQQKRIKCQSTSFPQFLHIYRPLSAVFADWPNVPSRRMFTLLGGVQRSCVPRFGALFMSLPGRCQRTFPSVASLVAKPKLCNFDLVSATTPFPSICSWRINASEIMWTAPSRWQTAMEAKNSAPFWSSGITLRRSCAFKSCRQRRSSSRSTKHKLEPTSRPSNSLTSMKLDNNEVFSTQFFKASLPSTACCTCLTWLADADAGRLVKAPLAGRGVRGFRVKSRRVSMESTKAVCKAQDGSINPSSMNPIITRAAEFASFIDLHPILRNSLHCFATVFLKFWQLPGELIASLGASPETNSCKASKLAEFRISSNCFRVIGVRGTVTAITGWINASAPKHFSSSRPNSKVKSLRQYGHSRRRKRWRQCRHKGWPQGVRRRVPCKQTQHSSRGTLSKVWVWSTALRGRWVRMCHVMHYPT